MATLPILSRKYFVVGRVEKTNYLFLGGDPVASSPGEQVLVRIEEFRGQWQ